MTQNFSSDKNRIVFVTGLSGAGMSSALKHLEDMGYETFDNFPLTLVDALLADPASKTHAVAIGIDTRSRGFDPATIIALCETAKAALLFMSADESDLLKRFTETRRRHPLALDRPASAGIKKEQELLHTLRQAATHLIDTTSLSVHDLRRVLEGHFALDQKGHLTITLMSFGYRFGIPREADIVMDVRFLDNPHWLPELRPLTGLDVAVGAHIRKDKDYEPFLESFERMLHPLLPRYAAEGKSYLTIAIGCTGGRHRSVYTAETLKPRLEERGFASNIVHRDISRS